LADKAKKPAQPKRQGQDRTAGGAEKRGAGGAPRQRNRPDDARRQNKPDDARRQNKPDDARRQNKPDDARRQNKPDDARRAKPDAAKGPKPQARQGSAVRIVFLGGLGEIGRNCACIEIDGRILVLDCGIMFPDPDMPGVDLVLPDFSYLRENAARVEGIVLTHGHEDHTGGLAFLLRDLSAPIYGSELTVGLASNRIREAGLLEKTQLIAVRDGERRRIGPCDVEFIPVTHSVPHAFALAFHTPQGIVLHSGDFKLDLEPVDGRRTDLARMGALAEDPGIRLLLADSNCSRRGPAAG
jgi:hypothetical protein